MKIRRGVKKKGKRKRRNVEEKKNEMWKRSSRKNRWTRKEDHKRRICCTSQDFFYLFITNGTGAAVLTLTDISKSDTMFTFVFTEDILITSDIAPWAFLSQITRTVVVTRKFFVSRAYQTLIINRAKKQTNKRDFTFQRPRKCEKMSVALIA